VQAKRKSEFFYNAIQLHVVSSLFEPRLDDELLSIADLVVHPVQLAEPAIAFGFISCGRRLKQPFAFYELTGVFDNYIWMAIIVFLVGVVPAVFCVFEEANSGLLTEHFELKSITDPLNWLKIQTFFASIRIVLEQGSGFTDKQMNVAPLRIIAGSVILVSIVLSNAYKNDNVYNMIKARNSVPFWYLNQLQQEKFEIVTRLDPFYRIRGESAKYLQEEYNLSVSSKVFSKHTLNSSIQLKSNGKFIQHKKYIYSELLYIYQRQFGREPELFTKKQETVFREKHSPRKDWKS